MPSVCSNWANFEQLQGSRSVDQDSNPGTPQCWPLHQCECARCGITRHLLSVQRIFYKLVIRFIDAVLLKGWHCVWVIYPRV